MSKLFWFSRVLRHDRRTSGEVRFLAACMSLCLPGLGQAYRGQYIMAVFWLVSAFIGYCMLIVPGLLIHALCIFCAGLD